jgi:hypothetical protein
MLEAPSGAIAKWLKELYKEIIGAEQAQDSFNRVSLLGNEAFRDRRESLSDEADRALLTASFVGDIPAMKKYLEGVDKNILDVIIFRFHLRFDELERSEQLFQMPDHGLQAPEALHLFLIVNDSIRRGPGGMN